MTNCNSSVRKYDSDPEFKCNFRTGVSLHCHTEASKEMLDFIPYYAEKLPIISYFWKQENAKRIRDHGAEIDFSDSYWSPPLDPSRVIDSEAVQINRAGLDAIVSITDHDSIDGTMRLNDPHLGHIAPISFEWTVPFRDGFFHLGIHNLPRDRAHSMTADLLDFTFNEQQKPDERLRELFEMLAEEPETLIVFNHPLWDIEMAGEKRHLELLNEFLAIYQEWIHTFEVNGFRSWSENKATMDLAAAYDKPVISGGDRHGCQPNTVINLTNAATFSEFVDEIRIDKRSDVAIMPEYEIPLHSRQLQSFSEILSFHDFLPEHRRRWFDRVFVDLNDGRGSVSLAEHGWKNGGPAWLRLANTTLGLLGGPMFRPIFRALRKRADVVQINEVDTIASKGRRIVSTSYLEAN